MSLFWIYAGPVLARIESFFMFNVLLKSKKYFRILNLDTCLHIARKLAETLIEHIFVQ